MICIEDIYLSLVVLFNPSLHSGTCKSEMSIRKALFVLIDIISIAISGVETVNLDDVGDKITS